MDVYNAILRMKWKKTIVLTPLLAFFQIKDVTPSKNISPNRPMPRTAPKAKEFRLKKLEVRWNRRMNRMLEGMSKGPIGKQRISFQRKYSTTCYHIIMDAIILCADL